MRDQCVESGLLFKSLVGGLDDVYPAPMTEKHLTNADEVQIHNFQFVCVRFFNGIASKWTEEMYSKNASTKAS